MLGQMPAYAVFGANGQPIVDTCTTCGHTTRRPPCDVPVLMLGGSHGRTTLADALLREHMFGFRRGIGVPEAVWVADELTTDWAARRKPLIEVLLDMRKAYDSARRIHVYSKLRRRGVPAHIIAVLQALFDGCHFIIALDGQLSERIAALVGLFQGAIGSPDLFNVLIDVLPYVDRTAQLGLESSCSRGLVGRSGLHVRDCVALLRRVPNARPHAGPVPVLRGRHAPACVHGRHGPGHDEPLPGLRAASRPRVERIQVDRIQTAGVAVRCRAGTAHADHRRQPRRRGGRARQARVLPGRRHEERPPRPPYPAHDAYREGREGDDRHHADGSVQHGAPVDRSQDARRRRLDPLARRVRARDQQQPRRPAEEARPAAEKSAVTLFFGGHRRRIGSVLMIRYAGLAPAAARQAKLRMRFAFKQIAWSEQIKDDDSVPFLVRVLRWALNNPHSRFNTMLKGCNVYADATAIYKNSPDAREQRAREELADAEAGRPSRKRPRLPDRQDALLQALELHTWTAADASCKLMRLQLQPYNLPFPAAYHSGDDAYAVASWVTNRIPGSNAQCRACNDKNLSRYHIAARCTESSRLLRPIIDWRIRALHFNRADTGVAIDYVAIQLNDYARLTAPPAREDGRLRPRRMPDPRDPTFRLSDRQRRWLAVLGKFIRAVAARCVRGEPLLISARGVAALAGLDATLWDEISDEEDNENARVAVQAAESVLDDPELAEFLGGVDRADPGDDADVRARQRARQLSPTAIMTAIVMRCIANAIGRPAEADAGPQHEARVLLRPDAPSPASSSGRVQSPLDGHSAAVLERRARSWRPPSTLRTPPILSFASSLSFSCSSCRVPDALAVF